MQKQIIFIILFIGLYYCITDCPSWSYQGSNGPEYWGSLCPAYETCDSGKTQSPINLQLDIAQEEDIKVNIFYENEYGLPFVNTGHTVEVRFDNSENRNEVVINNSDVYKLNQFHFHVPSENTMNGTHLDMEVHFVHSNTNGELFVIGVLITAPHDERPCDFLSQLTEYIPQQSGDINNVNINRFINFWSLKNYYSFKGSLTTPPCTEGVTFLIPSVTVLCSSKQVDDFFKVMGKSNRPIQDQNGREITYGRRF